MGTHIKPEERHWFCDACKTEDVQRHSDLKFSQIGFDFQGGAVGQNSVTLELCRICTSHMRATINGLQKKD